MRGIYSILSLFIFILFVNISASEVVKLDIWDDEFWWGAVIDDGYIMPFDQSTIYNYNLDVSNNYNQTQPLLISNKGRYIWCDDPFEFTIKNGTITIHANYGKPQAGQAGHSLSSVHEFVRQTFFPSSGKIPSSLLFSKPQYNTWIELNYNHNQEKILQYAHDIVKNDMPTGVFMIDDSWQTNFGQWTFNKERFSAPKAMIDELHDMGFKVMLWVVPFVSPDSPVFRELRGKDFFIKDEKNEPAIVNWWNGYSAVLDFTNPKVNEWFKGQLDNLTSTFDIDGFKFDGGDTEFYAGNKFSSNAKYPNEHTEAWARFGLSYPLNEYRACWKLGGHELAQRLHDKNHEWEDLQTLIPNIIVQGLMGYFFTCPDMIGGGDYLVSFQNLEKLDEELVVRSAQCQALMPMMQFSLAPWRALSKENFKICRQMAHLHADFGTKILDLADRSAKTGEPIICHMDFKFPHMGYEKVNDQFILGDDILVAPVLEKGARSRVVNFPPGIWKEQNGKEYAGPSAIKVDAPIDKLPWFQKVDD